MAGTSQVIANFIALGVSELAMAAALGRAVADRPSGWIATMALGVLGAAFGVAGASVTDPAQLVNGAHTVHGIVHALMAVVIFFIATPIAGLALGLRWGRVRGFALYCLLTALATLALPVATLVSGSFVGLAERVVIAVVLAWLTAVALRLLSDVPTL